MHYIYSCTCNKKPFEFRSQDFLSILRKLKLEIVQISNGNAMCALRASCFKSGTPLAHRSRESSIHHHCTCILSAANELLESRCCFSCQTFVARWKTMNNSLYATCGCETGRENGKSIMCLPDQTALASL